MNDPTTAALVERILAQVDMLYDVMAEREALVRLIKPEGLSEGVAVGEWLRDAVAQLVAR